MLWAMAGAATEAAARLQGGSALDTCTNCCWKLWRFSRRGDVRSVLEATGLPSTVAQAVTVRLQQLV